jgi:PhnB protein
MATFNPYLNFNGNTEEAFTFYKSVFGGEFIALQRFKDTPEGAKLSATEAEKIMHIALQLGPGTLLMATDALESMGHAVIMGSNFHISIDAESKEEADTLYTKLSAGGVAGLPMKKEFWGAYFGMLTDPYGIHWMISFDEKPAA